MQREVLHQPARTMKTVILSALFFVANLATAKQPPADKTERGTCYVCKYNNDLACVHFRMKPETPKLVYAGQTWFFCSTDCRDAFLKKPEKYLPKK